MLHNVYVNDLLRSVETVELVVRLIRDVKAMCQAGGFSLIKCISNKNMVTQSVPEYDRRNDVKNADVDTSVSLEKALGVYLHTENNIFRFKIVLKDKPMTRMGTLSIISSIFDPPGLAAPHTLRGKTILQLLAKMKLVGMELHLITSLENSSFGVKPCTV